MDKIDELLNRGVEKIYPSKEVLEQILRSGKKLRLYQGFDPSMPNLHLGNLVGILKLKQFQDLGHEVIFLVGDFTGMIGDPTDKSSTRQRLTREQVLENSKYWKEQAGRFLKFEGENPAKILFNSSWSDKVTFRDLIEITANLTVSQMIERDFFQERIKIGKPIFLHEFLYPVAQGYDSVAMDVDLEIGGNDQTFNMLCGRALLKAIKNKEKYVLTTKLLVDAKGQKAGKTAGNAFFLDVTPSQMYGGIMSFPDEVTILAFELLTEVPFNTVEQLKNDLRQGQINPMDLKKRLAFEIVKLNYGEEKAQTAQTEFELVFQKRESPSLDATIYETSVCEKNLSDLLLETLLVSSKSEAKRLLEQGSIEIGGQKFTPEENGQKIELTDNMVIRVGKKRFIKIKII